MNQDGVNAILNVASSIMSFVKAVADLQKRVESLERKVAELSHEASMVYNDNPDRHCIQIYNQEKDKSLEFAFSPTPKHGKGFVIDVSANFQYDKCYISPNLVAIIKQRIGKKAKTRCPIAGEIDVFRAQPERVVLPVYGKITKTVEFTVGTKKLFANHKLPPSDIIFNKTFLDLI